MMLQLLEKRDVAKIRTKVLYKDIKILINNVNATETEQILCLLLHVSKITTCPTSGSIYYTNIIPSFYP